MASRRTNCPHADDAGYVSSRRSALTNLHVVLYDGAKAGMECAAGRWCTICTAHGTVGYHRTRVNGREALKAPAQWCQECGKIASGGDAQEANVPLVIRPFRLKSPEEKERELRFWAKKVRDNPEKTSLFVEAYGVRPEPYWD